MIAQIKTALEGKAGGSGGCASVETCTVTITDEVGLGEVKIFYTSIGSDGKVTPSLQTEEMLLNSVEVPDVIVGSCVVLLVPDNLFNTATVSGDLSIEYDWNNNLITVFVSGNGTILLA